jgi:hypothetical protein
MSSRLLLDPLHLASSNPYSSFKPVGSSELPSLKLSDVRQNALHLLRRGVWRVSEGYGACPLDELEIAYEKECQEYAVARAGGSYVQREQQLAKEVDNKAIKLATCKTSPEMWKYSRIL